MRLWDRRLTTICCGAALLGLACLDTTISVRAADKGAKVSPAPVAPATSSPAVTIDQKIIDTAHHHSDLMNNLTYISDMIGSRLTGSKALEKANHYTAQKMREYGLENVHLEEWSIPVGWERGDISARMVEPDNGVRLSLASMAWTAGTKGNVEAEVVIIKAKNAKELEKYKGKLKNAVVLAGEPQKLAPITNDDLFGDMMRGMRGQRRQGQARNGQARRGGQPPRFDRARIREMIQFRRALSKFMRDEGALAVFMDSGKPQMLLNMTGSWRPTLKETKAQMPTYFVAHEHYAMLYRLATKGHTRISLDSRNKFIPGPIKVYNTVGEIRGTEKPEEVVICGGHLDSWDLGQGTTDNGTGSCVVLEAARMLAKCGVKPKRTIRFILFTGEEEGLRGSQAYVKAHKSELPKVSMAIIHDTGTGKVTGLGLMGHPELEKVMDPELVSLRSLGLTKFNEMPMGGSDHASFDSAGVPGFWFVQQPAGYRFTHHSQSDTLDKAQEPDLIQGATCMAVLAMRVADRAEMLPHHTPRPSPFERRQASASTPAPARR